MAPKISILISGDSPQKTYFPGQIVAGKICFNLDEKLKIDGLMFKFFGQAQVDFTKDYSLLKTLYYKAKEEFLQYELHIGFKDHRVPLPIGHHEFPFSFAVPLGLPSSYSGEHGQVTYQLRLKSNANDCGYYSKFVEEQVVLSINGDLDLKKELGVELPIEIAIKDKKICKSGPISLKLKIPKTGFVPGESINFLVEINNSSKKPVNSMEMTLIQKVEYHGKFEYWSGSGHIFGYIKNKETESLSKVILQQIVPGIAKDDSGSWSAGNSFKIPSTLPPTTDKLAGCKIIDVQYTLHFEATIDLNYKITKDIPITIGTISLAPPSYAEANLEKNGNTHGTGDRPSAPAGPI